MKQIIKLTIIGFLCFTLLALIIKERKTDYEIISPIPKITEKSVPTPTSTPKPEFSYYYGKASWYGEEFCHNEPCRTANGDWFDENKLTCACSNDFPLGSVLIVSHNENSIKVVCNDRGGFSEGYGRILDLSKKAFETLAPTSKGVIWVRIKKEL